MSTLTRTDASSEAPAPVSTAPSEDAAAPAALIDAESSGAKSASSSKKQQQQRAGRRPSAVWEFFAAIRTEHNTIHAQCHFCERRCAGVAARMVHHILSKCPAASPEAIETLGGEKAAAAAAAAVIAGRKRKTADVAAVATAGGEQGDSSEKKKKTSMLPTAARMEPEGLLSAAQESLVIGTTSTGMIGAGTTVVEGELLSVEQQVATAHQKLVLACLLNDVPLGFVEDDALMDAFTSLRPDFPRLTKQRAQTVVLEQVHRTVIQDVDAALRQSEHFAILHRHVRQQRHDAQASATAVCKDVWLGMDERRDPLILLAETSSHQKTTLREAETMLTTQSARLSPTATLSICSDSPELYYQLRQRQHEFSNEDGASPASPPDPRLRASLLGVCLLQQTMLLQKHLLRLAPSNVALLQEIAALVYSLVNHPKANPRLRASLLDVVASTESSRWDLHVRLVRRLLSLEAEVRAFRASEGETAAAASVEEAASTTTTHALPLHRESFWDELRELHALLAPFSWVFALSESDCMTSAQYLLLWLWLLSVVSTSSPSRCLSTDEKEAFIAHTMSVIRQHFGDHQLACMLLDPRVHGAGLSASGKRKVKTLVVHVAERVFAQEEFHIAGSSTRASLLAHLGHYAEKTAQFADVIAWEMIAGKAPDVFWKDYVDDARELAQVARALVKFVPQTQSAAAYFKLQQEQRDAGSDERVGGREESVRVRQIKQFYSKQRTRESRAPEDVARVYASVLLPIGGGPATPQDHAAPAASPAGLAGGTSGEALASHVLVAMTQQIQFMLSVQDDGCVQHDGETQQESRQVSARPAVASQPAVEGETIPTTASGSKEPTPSTNPDSDGNQECEQAAPRPAQQEKQKAEVAIDESWFAFRSAKERNAIESAIKRFFFSSATLVVV